MRSKAVGVMVLNSDLNLPLLNAHFQLLPFYGLRQPHTRDALHLPGWAKPRPELARALQVRSSLETETRNAGILGDKHPSASRQRFRQSSLL